VRLSDHTFSCQLSQAPFRRLLGAQMFVLQMDCSSYGIHQDITSLLSSQIMAPPETRSSPLLVFWQISFVFFLFFFPCLWGKGPWSAGTSVLGSLLDYTLSYASRYVTPQICISCPLSSSTVLPCVSVAVHYILDLGKLISR
jgi:hypothetical protein